MQSWAWRLGLRLIGANIFDVTLKNEVQYIMEHPDLPVTYRDIDRPSAGNVNEMLKNEGKEEKSSMHRLRPTMPWQWR